MNSFVLPSLAFATVIVCLSLSGTVNGHGMIVDPPSRSMMSRYGYDVPVDYNPNALNCGGFAAQYDSVNQGRCGECGDEWKISRPRPNDEGGIYGTGQIGQTYAPGSWVRFTVQLTANHKGFFEFRLCPKQSAEELVTQECLDQHLLILSDGSTRFPVDPTSIYFFPIVQLPVGVVCEHCVIQWKYTTGNNWGICEDGTGANGCGNQETFVNCADVAIL